MINIKVDQNTSTPFWADPLAPGEPYIGFNIVDQDRFIYNEKVAHYVPLYYYDEIQSIHVTNDWKPFSMFIDTMYED